MANTIRDLARKNRSCRRFLKDPVKWETLLELVDIARLSPSAANLQPLRYALSCDADKNALIFPHLRWAGYLKEWKGPSADERPTAYIIILGDTKSNKYLLSKIVGCDHGIAAQSILLGAREKDLAGCIIGSIDKRGLKKALNLSKQYEILLVLALGRPKEEAVIETIEKNGDIKYWRDDEARHHVPKRKLEDLIVE